MVDQRRGKRAYKALRARVANVLRRADPIRLISIGAPDDEYDPEIRTIISRLKETSSGDEVLEVVHQESSRWFGERIAGPKEGYRTSASEIWQAWQQFKDEVG